MGVHGLTTFLREYRSTLSKTIHFSPQYAEYTPLVVDGWSFIYKLFEDSGLPWVYGGEYDVFSELIVKVVKAWLAVRLRPIFVFDGSLPPVKFATAVSRKIESFIKPSELFFRTSAASRNKRWFLNESYIIPPLVHTVTVHTLFSMQDELAGGHLSDDEEERLIELHFADEEADSYAVDLAGRVGGYVTGRDSDFVVYNSEGYLGYIPLEEMVWLISEEENAQDVSDELDDGFQSVKRKKRSAPKQTSTFGMIPPDAEIYSLSVSLFTPSALAQLLKLPVSLLPLLGAIVGNDYTLPASDRPVYAFNPKSFQNLLFERRLNLPRRILHASSVLNSCLHGHSSKRRQKKPQSVMELIQMTIGALLTGSGAPAVLIGSGQQEAIVEAVAEGTLPYAIPLRPADDVFLSETVCALHEPFECQLVAQMDRTGIEGLSKHAEAVSALYLRAYRLGQFSPLLMDILSTRTSWPRIFLENPDMEAVSRSVSRHVREFGYALLEAGVIIPAPPVTENEAEKPEDEADSGMEEDPDEMIDVVEQCEEEYEYEDEISADVGKLRGKLRELQFDEDDPDNVEHSIDERSSMAEDSSVKGSTAASSSVRSPAPLYRPAYVRKAISAQRKVVTEYVRRGARVVTEEIEVRPLRQFNILEEDETTTIPVQLRSEDDRLNVLFRFLQIDPQEISALPEEEWMPIMALRLVVRRMHDRAAENITSKERQLEKWTRREARTFLASISQTASSRTSSLEPPAEISERAIQLTAQISTALEALEHLIQILLLADAIPGCVHRFSGLRFHSLLALDTDVDVADDIWRVFTNGLNACFEEERKGKKAKRKAQKEDSNGNGKAKVTSLPSGRAKTAGRSGMYSILAGMSA
ncbi:PIN domain-like protein [Fomitiporia mediterranea MF3/22]|uniref:PIN domain-like protein n=1 Tax=Fomitiporia mediterranea (strain MF3/22) TaxID=694068 RepID=UPI00044090A1|nr:PIN domain-like protein [Fomitiporia mediterranea MF3/22]EJD02205.1 PIN domain-like protein [Fomitiporia mediterranea MF3/22]